MKKHCKRRPRAVGMPYLVAAATIPELEISERLALQAFKEDWAIGDHYDTLACCRNMLLIAGQSERDDAALKVAILAGVSLTNIEERHKGQERYTATPTEWESLLQLVNFAEGWWRRKNGALYIRTSKVVDALYKTDLKEAQVA